jgi:transposase
MKEATFREELTMRKFEGTYNKFNKGEIGCEQASELIGCSIRQFHRKRKRYEDEGLLGLHDRRLGKPSHNRSADAEVEVTTKLYREKYNGFSVRHFYDYLELEQGANRSYSWVKTALEREHLVTPSKRGGNHRLRRPRSPMRGMMLHQDASKHQWISGVYWDLVVTMDDATSEIYSAIFVEEEGTNSTFLSLQETIEKQGVFCSLYTDSHYFTTPEAGSKVDKHNLTEVGRALKQLNIRHIAAYSPQARGRSERMFRTLQARLPNELKLNKITNIDAANKYLKQYYLPKHNKKFMAKPASEDTAFIALNGINLANIFCVKEERIVKSDNTIHFNNLVLQIPKNENRNHFVRATVAVHQHLNDDISLFFGPMCIGKFNKSGTPIKKYNIKIAA